MAWLSLFDGVAVALSTMFNSGIWVQLHREQTIEGLSLVGLSVIEVEMMTISVVSGVGGGFAVELSLRCVVEAMCCWCVMLSMEEMVC